LRADSGRRATNGSPTTNGEVAPVAEPLQELQRSALPAALWALGLAALSAGQAAAGDAVGNFDGPGGLAVEVHTPRDTGTMHFARKLILRLASGERLELPDKASRRRGEEQLPILERVLDAGRGRWVLLGWRSGGGGTQSTVAWLVARREGGLALLDRLELFTSRASAGLAIDAGGGSVRLGVPRPGAPGTGQEDDFPWSLRTGPRGAHRTPWQTARLLAVPGPAPMALQDFYTPPFQDPPAERGWDGQLLWVDVGLEGFALPPTGRR
jgi:hypothetical protein